jgi:hypothetical protein
MIKRYCSIVALFLVSICCSYGQEEDPAKALIEAMKRLKAIASETVPLAKDQFAIIETKFKGDQYNDLVARIHTPLMLSEVAINLDLDEISGWVEQDESESVATTVLEMASELRALDGVLLAEAIAGSTRETELLDLYQKEEVAVLHVILTYQTWANKPD